MKVLGARAALLDAQKLLITVLLFIGCDALASSSGPRYLMGSLGDSITVAFMADTKLSDYSTNSLRANARVQSIDEIQKMNTDNRWTLSWSSGNQIKSHYILINKYLNLTEPNAKIDVQNYAVTGAVSNGLLAQADKLVAGANETIDGVKKYDSLKYVTILIGANDSCARLSNDTIKQNLLAVFSKLNLINQAEPIKILVSGLPKIPDVGSPEIQSSPTVAGFSCHFLQTSVTHTCLGLTQWTNESEYADDVAYVMSKNTAIEAAVNEGKKLFSPNLDIFYSGVIFNKKIVPQDLAFECFHPNSDAQQVISESLWAQIPWFH
jgi:lysophospholipase L1-like esterase